MFCKPFKTKSSSQMTGSERRILCSKMLKSFPKIREDHMVQIITQNNLVSCVKLLTHNGELVTVYVVEKLPLVFLYEDVLYPTVYMLWDFPNILPVFTIKPQDFPPLRHGADLMLSEVMIKGPIHMYSYGWLAKGATAAINLTTNKAAFAVGVTALSSFNMYMAAKRGKAIKIYHTIGDHLWALGNTLTAPELGPPAGFENAEDVQKKEEVETEDKKEVTTTKKPPADKVQPEVPESGVCGYPSPAERSKEAVVSQSSEWLQSATVAENLEGSEESIKEMPHVSDTSKSAQVEEDDEKETAITKKLSEDKVESEALESGAWGYTALAERGKEAIVSQLSECMPSEGHEESRKKMPQLSDKPASCTNSIKKEMDELLLYCFLKAWKTTAKGIELPTLTGNFYSLHMLPACPVGESVNVKKSSYKKLSKFMSDMEIAGILKLKELTKGVESIISVDYGHSMLKEFVDTKCIPETVTKQEDISKKDLKLEITEMYGVTAAVLPVFSSQGYKKGDNLSVADIRKSVAEYIKSNKLQSTSDKRRVNLNPVIKRVLQCHEADSMQWEDLMAKLLGQMSNSYQITYATGNIVAVKGKLQAIDIQILSIWNNKVTVVNNLELYKINLQEFARECQHGVAASTTINTIPGMKGRQVLIQGNQVAFVIHKLIEKYNIPIKYINAL